MQAIFIEATQPPTIVEFKNVRRCLGRFPKGSIELNAGLTRTLVLAIMLFNQRAFASKEALVAGGSEAIVWATRKPRVLKRNVGGPSPRSVLRPNAAL